MYVVYMLVYYPSKSSPYFGKQRLCTTICELNILQLFSVTFANIWFI